MIPIPRDQLKEYRAWCLRHRCAICAAKGWDSIPVVAWVDQQWVIRCVNDLQHSKFVSVYSLQSDWGTKPIGLTEIDLWGQEQK